MGKEYQRGYQAGKKKSQKEKSPVGRLPDIEIERLKKGMKLTKKR